MFSQDVLAQDETGQKGDPEADGRAGHARREPLRGRAGAPRRHGDAMEADPLLEHIRTRVTDEGLIIEVFDIPGSPLFDGATAEPNPIFGDLVRMIGRVLSHTVNPVAVTGHLATGDVGRGGAGPVAAVLGPGAARADAARGRRRRRRAGGAGDRQGGPEPGRRRPARPAQPAGRDHAAAEVRPLNGAGLAAASSAQDGSWLTDQRPRSQDSAARPRGEAARFCFGYPPGRPRRPRAECGKRPVSGFLSRGCDGCARTRRRFEGRAWVSPRR